MNPVRFRVETDRSISSVCFFPGGHGGVATPVPIPNTEVKGSSGEGTAGIARGRVARCQDFFSGEDVVGYPPLFLLCRVSARGGWRAATGDGRCPVVLRVRNGGRARCPHRAARVMRVPRGRG